MYTKIFIDFEKDSDSWDSKIHGPRNYLQSFYVADIIEECWNKKYYPLAMFRNGIPKKKILSYKGTMKNGTTLSSSDSEMASKKKKNHRATFEEKMNTHCYSLKMDDDTLLKNRSKTPDFVLRPLKSMINVEVERLSLQKLKYEIDCTDNPVDSNFFEIGYCVHANFPYANIQFKQAINLIFSYLLEENYPFIHDTLKNKNTPLV